MAKKQVVVGIDIGGTNTGFGFVNREGKILGEDSIKTAHYDEIEVFIAALYEKIMVTAHKIGNGIELIGFGVGAPMGNINKGTIEHAADLPFKGVRPFAEIFNRHTDLPVIVTNDANAAAVGEMVYGGARGMKNFVVIGLALAKDLIFEPAREYMEENLLSIYKGKVKLLASELSTQNAAVLGASSLVWSLREPD